MADDGDNGPLLWIAGVTKRRGSAPAEFRLEVPEFVVQPGEFVAVVGASGCGKSTLLDMLALISRPDEVAVFRFATSSGHADIAALWQAGTENALSRLRARAIGYVLQTGGLLPFLSVAGNAELVCSLAGCDDGEARIAALAERLGILTQCRSKPRQLSGGQRQRAAIVRALVHRPALVLADEPTAAVDRTRAVQIVADLRRVAREERTAVVMVTHDLQLIENVADRCYGFTLTATDGLGTVSVCQEVTP